MKKTIAILSLACILVNPICTFAETTTNLSKFNQEKSQEFKQTFNITDDFQNFDFSTNTWRDEKTYTYNWNSSNSSIMIETDEAGNIVSYNNYAYNRGESKAAPLKDKVAIEKIATDFLDKIDKTLVDTYKLKDFKINLRNNSANLTYARYVNDILVLNDALNLNVNLKEKNVGSFSRLMVNSIKNESFPEPSKALSPEKAKEILFADNPLKLSYLITENNKKFTAIPVYSTLGSDFSIDAISGKIVSDNIRSAFYEYPESNFRDFEFFEESLDPVEKNEANGIKNLAKEEDAKKVVEEKLNLSNVTYNRVDLSKYNGDDYLYRVNYIDKNNNETSVSLNAITLEILSFNSWNPRSYNYYSYSDKPVKLSDDEVIKISTDFIKKINPESKVDFENPVVSNFNNYENYVNYYNLKDNLPVIGNEISISIDSKTKSISSYYTQEKRDVEFSPISKDIGAEKALQTAFEKQEFKKYYVIIENKPRLIYTFKNNSIPYIKADDGSFVDYSGKPVDEINVTYKNIDKSKYKDEINYLISSDIGIPNVEILTDKISGKDFIYLLNTITNEGYIYDSSIKSLENNFENFSEENLTKNVSNKLAVRWILNSKNFYNLDSFNNVFNEKTFSDYSSIAKEDLPYFYIAKGLSIFDFEKASPDSELTYEEALHLIYNIVK